MIEGDFSHRIEVTGKDQLAELSLSFNRMTENLERLLVVAKEKERLESEIEIAREVQSQLFPREIPETAHAAGESRLPAGALGFGRLLRLTRWWAIQQVALAIADVAGKGISAALLDGRAAKLPADAVAECWLEVVAGGRKRPTWERGFPRPAWCRI